MLAPGGKRASARLCLTIDELLRRNAQIFPYPQSYLGLRTEAFKLIVRFGENGAIDRRELFDLLHDANEASSVDDSNVDLVEQWTRRVVDSYEAMATKDDLPQLELDPDSARALRALGYIE